MDKELTKQDRLDYQVNMGKIERGGKTMTEVMIALAQNDQRQLWEAQDGGKHAYLARVRDALGFSTQRIRQYRIAGEIIAGLLMAPEEHSENVTQVPLLPATERQARELARLGNDPVIQAEVFAEAVEAAEGRQPTTREVRKAVNERLKLTPPDGRGGLVTITRLRDSFLSRGQLKKAANHLTSCTRVLKRVFASQHGTERLTHAKTTQKIGYARTEITAAMPYCVCPDCESVNSDACERCTGRGWLTEGEAAKLDE